jgi:serine/threonine-protein kinase
MTPEQWERIQALFDRGAQIPLEEQAGFLSEACADDPELRAEVADLLRADTESGEGAFIHSAIAAVARHLSERGRPAQGQRVGSYRLGLQLGQGGMGAVYLAERADDQYRQQVAIKFVRGGLATPELDRRFRAERQILADLVHPNIARLLDGGTTEDGTPYLVMEYIQGEPIDAYCERRGLSLRERLQLFREVCTAVQHAHQSLVVHRDIKPSNVLVNAEGTPKLLDFGIAKLLDVEAHTAAETSGLFRVMTPSYASPEQIRGDRVTVATDIYSLGVVLYRVLTGRHPLDLEGATPSEVERRISTQEPERPSAVAGLPVLAGDLDNIVLLALRKEPERRYASVAALEEDIGRYLAGQPVRAREDTRAYRAGKFVRRHIVGVGSTAAVLIGGGGVVTYYTLRLAAERDRSRVEALRAEHVSGFLTGLFALADPSEAGGEKVTARMLLDRGTAKIDAELSNQPEIRATLKQTMSQAYRYLGSFERAVALASEALATRRALFGEDDPTVAAALTTLAQTVYETGDRDSTEALILQAIAIRRQAPDTPDSALATNLNDLGWLAFERGDYRRADSLHREALALRQRSLDDNHPDVAESLANLGAVRYDLGDFAAADSLYRRALAVRRNRFGDRHRLIEETLSNLALVREGARDYVVAESLYRAAVSVGQQLHGTEYPGEATTRVNLGRVLRLRGRLDEAEVEIRRALDLDLRFRGAKHPDVAYDLRTLADLEVEQGRSADAVRNYREALRIYSSLGEDESSFVAVLAGLGRALLIQSRPREAEPLLRKALMLWEGSLPAGHHQIGRVQGLLGAALVEQERYGEAEPLLTSGYQVLRSSRGADDPDTRNAARYLERLRRSAGRSAQSR